MREHLADTLLERVFLQHTSKDGITNWQAPTLKRAGGWLYAGIILIVYSLSFDLRGPEVKRKKNVILVGA